MPDRLSEVTLLAFAIYLAVSHVSHVMSQEIHSPPAPLRSAWRSMASLPYSLSYPSDQRLLEPDV